VIFLQVIPAFQIFVNGVCDKSEIYQGFLDDKKVEEH